MASYIKTESAIRPQSSGVSSTVIIARGIEKSFVSFSSPKQRLQVLSDFNLELKEGEIVTLFGPNGSGKSTILNILAGILEPDSGEVIRNGVRHIGYVFQNYADTLLPWRTVRGNIEFPLEFRQFSEEEKNDKVNNILAQFQLIEHANKYIYQLSGGLKQLVSIAKSAVYDPQLLLLDEPFSAIDYSTSRLLWLRMREFWDQQKMATVFVSHNIDEAIFIGDRVLVVSARPAQVIADIAVPLERGRNLSLLSSSEFFTVRNQVLEAFERGRSL